MQTSRRVRERRNYREEVEGEEQGGEEMEGRKKGSNFGSGWETSLF